MPPALDALSRRPTRPTLAVAGKSNVSTVSCSSAADEETEMEAHSSLKRKQQSTVRKKVDPKKGKH